MRRSERSVPTIVYSATNLINGKRYVGITSKSLNTRRFGHFKDARRGSKVPFHAAIRKYGEEFFSFRVVASCHDYVEAMQMEVRLISLWRPKYNATAGGDGMRNMPIEVRRKIGDSARGRTYPNRKRPPKEARENLSRIGKENNAAWQAAYARLGPAATARPVMCIDDGARYDSASAAARAYGVARSSLIELCLKNPRRKTVGGLRFAYIDADRGAVSNADS